MRLITEINNHVTPSIITEGTLHKFFIEGVFLMAEVKNKNGRVYPLELLTREVNRYKKEFVSENRALGELGHPESPSINLDRVSHLIVDLHAEGHDFIGKALILDTPNGKIVKALISEGVTLGVSSRGVGSLKTTSQGDIVGDDFFLATAADIVADPSAPEAFVRGIMENKEWVWQNGALTEAQIAEYKKELTAVPKKKVSARKIDEAKVFEQFVRAIRIIVN